MTDLEFRQAAPGDAALLARMNQQLIRDEGHGNSVSLLELEKRMSSWLQAEYKAYIFLKEETPIGYVLFRPDATRVYLRQLFVLPEFRRKGVARASLAWLRSNVWQIEQGLRTEVLIHNKAAISFWRAVGFKDYALTMELDKSKS